MPQVSSKFKSTILFNAVPRKSYAPYLVYAFQGEDDKEVGFFEMLNCRRYEVVYGVLKHAASVLIREPL